MDASGAQKTFISCLLHSKAAPILLAALLYCVFVFIGFFPDSLHILNRWPAWFEDPSNCYRIWWFSQVIYGGREGTIWFMPDILWPYGIRTVQTSNGLGKELIAALLGGGAAPWLAGNIIALSTPVLVGTAAFISLRRLMHGAFLPAFAGGWMAAWAGYYTAGYVYPWVASAEGLVVYILGILLLRRSATWRRMLLTGIAAGVSVWLNAQMLVYVAGIGLVFAFDRLLRRRWDGILCLLGAAVVGGLIALPVMLQIWKGYEGDFEAMAGVSAQTDYFRYSNRLLSPFIPPEFVPHFRPDIQREVLLPNLFGTITTTVKDSLPFPLQRERGIYIGWIVLVMAVVGWRSRHHGTGFLASCAVFFLLLSYGPILTQADLFSEELPKHASGPVRYILGPFAFLQDYPIFNTMRTPMRLILVTQVCMGLLAGFGVLRILRIPALRKRKWLRTSVVTIILGLHFFDQNTETVLFPPQYTPFWEVMAKDGEQYTVLDIPYGRGAHQHMHYAAYHGKRTPWGFGSRVPWEQFDELERALGWAMIATGPPHTWPRDHDRFARNLVLYDVRYIVLHEMHLNYNLQAMQMRGLLIDLIENPRTWSHQTYIEPPRMVHRDEVARVYEIIPRKNANPLEGGTISQRMAYLKWWVGLTPTTPLSAYDDQYE